MRVSPVSYTHLDVYKRQAYARVSTASDAQLHSLGAQIDFYKKQIMSRPDWEFAGVFIDDGVTGTKSKREGLDELLTACRDGKIDLIITKSISRFARNTVDLLNLSLIHILSVAFASTTLSTDHFQFLRRPSLS